MPRAPRDIGDKVVIASVADASPKPYPLARIPNNVSYVTVSDQPEAEPNQPIVVPISFHGGIGYARYDPAVAGSYTASGPIGHEPNVLLAPRGVTSVTLTGAANPPNYFFETAVNDGGADDGQPVLYIIANEAAEINVYKISLTFGGDNGTANAAVTTTNTTLTDTREAWTTDEWIGDVVTCNSKTMTVTGNTAAVLTGASWSGGGNPGDGNSWIMRLGGFSYLLNTKTFAVTPTQPCGRPVEWNDGSNTKWYLGLGDNNFIQRLTTIVSSTAADTWTASGDADARHLKIVSNQLMRSTDENQVSVLAQGADPLTEANWGGDFFAGDVSANITELGEASGLAYIAKEDGFYEWDLTGEAANVFPEIEKADRNGQGMVYWHGGFMIPAESGLAWTRTGKPEGPDSNPNNEGNSPSLATNAFIKHGRWNGLQDFGEYLWALYIPTGSTEFVMWARERDRRDTPGWGSLIWHIYEQLLGDLNDFHGAFIARTSEFSATETRPCLWVTNANNITYCFLDKNGAPASRRGDLTLSNGGTIRTGLIDGGFPRVLKQLHYIDGWAEDMKSGHSWQLSVYRDGGSEENVGATITTDGYFQRFWTQDSNDTARGFISEVSWVASSNKTSQNGPHLRDVRAHLVALPSTTREWTFLFAVEDEQGKTAKKIRSELEAYVGDLKKYTLPDRDTFNGVMGAPRMLRADEINRLTPRNQEPPHYVIAATVREMSGS
ncbi:hypothetical protein LCGC14_1191950 [marine sediment metagenome]|uniref:Uncharacterized protein n=2 Tax=marine sediment metagenome TaxID=412755 RepID=A0A0F9LNX3_9ZZZZ